MDVTRVLSSVIAQRRASSLPAPVTPRRSARPRDDAASSSARGRWCPRFRSAEQVAAGRRPRQRRTRRPPGRRRTCQAACPSAPARCARPSSAVPGMAVSLAIPGAAARIGRRFPTGRRARASARYPIPIRRSKINNRPGREPVKRDRILADVRVDQARRPIPRPGLVERRQRHRPSKPPATSTMIGSAASRPGGRERDHGRYRASWLARAVGARPPAPPSRGANAAPPQLCTWQMATPARPGVVVGRLDQPQEQPHHLAHLPLLGPAVADDRQLDFRRRVLDQRVARFDRREQRDAPRLAERERAADVRGVEDALDGHAVRPVPAQEPPKLPVDGHQSLGKGRARRRCHRPARHEAVPGPVGFDAAVPRSPRSGIDAAPSLECLELLLVDVHVRPHVLHVVVILRGDRAASACSAPTSLDRRWFLRQHRHLGRRGFDAELLDGLPHRRKMSGALTISQLSPSSRRSSAPASSAAVISVLGGLRLLNDDSPSSRTSRTPSSTGRGRRRTW